MKRLVLALLLVLAAGCKREERRFEEVAPTAQPAQGAQIGELHAGGPVANQPAATGPYQENAYAISEGQRLYNWFNCVGCHAHGGGAIGPALMDNRWIYGSEPQNIYNSIVEGRPNGMPSFRGKIPDQQVWQLVAYVRSLSGLVPMNAQSARTEHLEATPPPTLQKAAKPAPQPAEHAP